MKRSTKVLLSVFAVFLTLMTAATLTLCVVTLAKVNAADKAAAAAAEEEKPAEDSENGVVIAEKYTIRPTRAISDAYLSGDSSKLDSNEKETLGLASAVLDEIIEDGMTDYEKEYAVFTWIHENIRNDSGGLTLIQPSPETVSEPGGVLRHKKAVCVGYATTFRLLMQMLDIPCRVVHDTSLVHSWDLVQIGGGWYHVDLYSADGIKDPFGYLNLTDDMMARDWDRSQYPAADKLEYCYLYKNASPLDDIYAIPAKLKAALDAHQTYLGLLYKPTSENDRDIAEYLMGTLSYRISSSAEYSDISFNYSVAEADGMLLIGTTIFYPDDYEEDLTTPEGVDEVKIDQAITNAFGELTDAYDDEYLY